MKAVLESIKPVVNVSEFVSIDEEAINKFTKTVGAKDFEDSEFSSDTILKSSSEEDHIAFTTIYNSINFCYWGEPKWTITINNQAFDGSSGMLRALKNAIENGFPLLDTRYLAQITRDDLNKILLGNIEIPLFDERLENLRILGKNTLSKYGGSFKNILIATNGDAVNLANTLVNDFPEVFNDEATYNDKKVKFYKRAQLVPALLFDLHKFKIISTPLTGYNELLAFADYKVPQMLRKFGVLKYSEDLANRVDNKIELPKGSNEEVEIRANTIWAIETATNKLKSAFPQANAANVDGIFWFRGLVKSPNDKPYHRTRTSWY